MLTFTHKHILVWSLWSVRWFILLWNITPVFEKMGVYRTMYCVLQITYLDSANCIANHIAKTPLQKRLLNLNSSFDMHSLFTLYVDLIWNFIFAPSHKKSECFISEVCNSFQTSNIFLSTLLFVRKIHLPELANSLWLTVTFFCR